MANTPSHLAFALLLCGLSVSASAENASMQDAHSGKVDSVDSLTQGLRQRLDKNPGDVKGWVLLAKSYQYLQRWDDASAAYEKAHSLGYDGPVIPSTNSSVSKPKDRYHRKSPHANISNAMAQGIAEAVNKTPVSTAAPGIKVSLDIAPELLKSLPQQSSVFIFVRAAEQAGPPLAAVRKKIAELPLTVIMDDSMSMMPGSTISSASKVIVGARISISGNAIKSKGDIEVFSNVIASDSTDTVDLVLSKNSASQ